MSFRHATIARWGGTAFPRMLFLTALTPFSPRAGRRTKDYANPDAACRRGPANCRGTSLRSRSERSGPIAFARSLRPVAEYSGPKARCGGSRHRAGGESQAGLSTAHSRGGPLRQGTHLRMRPSMPWRRQLLIRASRWRNTTPFWRWHRTIPRFAKKFVSAFVLRPSSRSSSRCGWPAALRPDERPGWATTWVEAS
jgi:hypothetical protein